MNMDSNEPVAPAPAAPEKKKSNTPLIIGIVVAVVLCCCCVLGLGGWWLWNNGDQLFNMSPVLPTLLKTLA